MATTENEAKRRSAYGRGLIDGLRMAGVNPEIHMNEKRLASIAELAVLLRSCAAAVESEALEVEERIGASEQETQKLRQLQALLKSIGSDV